MTADYERRILDHLLDRFERSRHAAAPGSSRRGVFLPCDPERFPDYWDDRSADIREAIHAAVASLARQGIVAPRWVRGREGRELDRIDLCLDQVAAAYARAGRVPPWERRRRLAEVAAAWSWPAGDWREAFRQDLLRALAEGDRLPGRLTAETDPAVVADLFRVLDALGNLEGEVPRRLFSQQVLGDTKRLEEALLPHLERVLASYHPACQDWDEGEAAGESPLERVGLVPHPQPLLVAGPVALALPGGGRLDLGAFHPWVGLPPAMLDLPVAACGAQRVVTVENLTSFHRLAAVRPAGWVALFLGGFPRGSRLRLLQALVAAGARWYHWGDLDLGGFRNFVYLQRASGLPGEPYRMDAATFDRYRAFGRPFDERYRARLEALLGEPDYAPFHGAIRAMLAAGLRLEQESVPPLGEE